MQFVAIRLRQIVFESNFTKNLENGIALASFNTTIGRGRVSGEINPRSIRFQLQTSNRLLLEQNCG